MRNEEQVEDVSLPPLPTPRAEEVTIVPGAEPRVEVVGARDGAGLETNDQQDQQPPAVIVRKSAAPSGASSAAQTTPPSPPASVALPPSPKAAPSPASSREPARRTASVAVTVPVVGASVPLASQPKHAGHKADAGRPREPWADVPRKRSLPRKARIAIAVGVAALVIVMIAGRGSRPGRHAAAVLEVDPDLIVNEKELKHRREVSPAQFRPKESTRRGSSPSGSTVIPNATPPEDPATVLAARRARRAEDPNAVPAPGAARRPTHDEPVQAGPAGVSGGARSRTIVIERPAPGATGAKSPADRAPRVAAGETLEGTLANVVELDGSGSSTVVAVLDQEGGALPAGTRLLGTASRKGTRAKLQFRKLVLPDGREFGVRVEGQDEDGSFGIALNVPGREDHSLERDVAEDTATDVVLGALGAGVVGGAASRYASGSRRRDRARPADLSVTIAAGTPLKLFFHTGLGEP